jgi:hypothetical protein
VVYSGDPQRPDYLTTSSGFGKQSGDPEPVDEAVRRLIKKIAGKRPRLDARGVYDALAREGHTVSLDDIRAVLPRDRW